MTGGEAKILVEEEEVRVDGVIETRKRRKLRGGMVVAVGRDEITLVSPSSEDRAHPDSG